MRQLKVLVAEDDALIREGLIDILEDEGYTTTSAADGQEALDKYRNEAPNVLLLDIMMPQMSGYDVCKEIRADNRSIPIIFISAKSEEIDKVVGLELGADDFIVKPFGIKEVIARIRAVTRRCFAATPTESKNSPFVVGPWNVWPNQLKARWGARSIELSLRETKLLHCFAQNEGVVLNREMIFNCCWDENFYPSSRTLDQHIVKLRKKIEPDPKKPQIILTVHGAGYRYTNAHVLLDNN